VPYGDVADVIEDIVEAYLALRDRPEESSSIRSSASASNLSGSGSMPLVKDGKITGDLFVHVPDGGELPGEARS
jgi:hypothetical protein